MFDWNHNDKNDMSDNFIEYHLINKDTRKQENQSPYISDRGKGISISGVVISIIAGFLIQPVLYVILGIDVESIPVPVIYLLWIVFSILIATLINKLGS
ncbi:MAG: hypothetical protein Q4E73_05345 [Lachnospiraceae bacterium]|nr:hypothetical protein [Lachnospiraceae bacterium]